MNARILIVEDEAGIAEVLADLLKAEGHEVEVACDGQAGLHSAANGKFDVLLLDVMLPGKSGFDICREVRAGGFTGGILMLTARGQVDDRVKGLRTGADDYVVKPFDSDELVARIDALLRRLAKPAPAAGGRIRFGDIEADFVHGEYSRKGAPIALSGKEAELLRLLVRHAGHVASREMILAEIWKDQPFITPRTVDVHVAWLRQKIEEHPQMPRHLFTVRGEGYRFEM